MSESAIVWRRIGDLETEVTAGRALDVTMRACQRCGVFFAGPAPIMRGRRGETVIVCLSCKEASMMASTAPSAVIPTTRAERAEAYADLYEVTMEEIYRRYGAVLLPRPAIGDQRSAISLSEPMAGARG